MIVIEKDQDYPYYHLIVNGDKFIRRDLFGSPVVYTLSELREYKDIEPKPEGFKVLFNDPEIGRRFISYSFSDFSEEIKVMEFRIDYYLPNCTDFYHGVEVRRNKSNAYEISLYFLFNAEKWKHLWSIEEYLQELTQIVNCTAGLYTETDIEGIMSVWSTVEDSGTPIQSEALKLLQVVEQLHHATELSLTATLRKEAVVMQFDFPEEIRVPCEQYLLYFIQFLHDLGIEALANIEHSAGQMLFAVTPTDKEIALDKIRIALEIYLRLPSSPVSDLSTNDAIAIQRLESNIYHFKSQLKLAHAEILTNERTIQAQQTIIDSQQRLIDGLVILDSAKSVSSKKESEDKEDLLPGILAVTKYKGKGFELGLPEIIRRLKEFLHRK